MTRIKSEYSSGQVDRSGKVLITPGVGPDQMTEALAVMNGFRSAHGYPLEVALKTLRKGATKINPKVIIAERLKRLPSITAKLRREPNMKLSQMQDIGGCRAVFRDINEVNQLLTTYPQSDLFKDFKRTDYIQRPKRSGYRGIHLVWRYRSQGPSSKEYDGMRVEVQIRSALQHAWATAVEIASTYTNSDLKSDTGDPKWIRFFSLMGGAIAIREGCPPVPDTPSNKSELNRELRKLSDELKVQESMRNWSQLTNIRGATATETSVDARVFLVALRLSDYRWQLRVTPFSESDSALASEEYLKAEKENAEKRGVQVVLVSVESIDMLRQAYPNYYMDTTEFLKALQTALHALPSTPVSFGHR